MPNDLILLLLRAQFGQGENDFILGHIDRDTARQGREDGAEKSAEDSGAQPDMKGRKANHSVT